MDLFRRNKKENQAPTVSYPSIATSSSEPNTSTTSSSTNSYPRVAQPVPTISRSTSFASPGPPTIKIKINPALRVDPAPQLSEMGADVPATNFSFDTTLERQILAERTTSASNRSTKTPPSLSFIDPLIQKYVNMGLHKDAIILALAIYGDTHKKILDFCAAFSLFSEMGFPYDKITSALIVCDNDREKALALLAP